MIDISNSLKRYFIKIWRLISILKSRNLISQESNVLNLFLNVRDLLTMKKKLKAEIIQNGELEKINVEL